ncbi:YrhC family protein [Metabacillus arenae]|uniref:YrhC-like protein n=1 Tax=Metabacillus arenae TaxID=2771434 RepID=A0A926NQ92_9BACI|nr:YrhC family protein [Metabacillus arenae]MBD1382062.1 hypothetical protein [Metabacillus arenae]
MSNKHLRERMIDFKSYAYVLLAVSVFLYIGVLIPGQTEETAKIVLMGTTALFLASAFYFFSKSIKIKKRIEESEE